MKRSILIILFLTLVGACTATQASNLESAKGLSANPPDRPILAVWRDTDGNTYAPRLRIAIWNDGRILFSKETPKWGTNLFSGHLMPTNIISLKQRVEATGVFSLKRTNYVRPDEPWCCMLIDFGDKQRTFYWDEHRLQDYWKRDQSDDPAGDFKEIWARINRIALDFLPTDVKNANESFKGAPNSWYVGPPGP